jgi:hypothetical protein
MQALQKTWPQLVLTGDLPNVDSKQIGQVTRVPLVGASPDSSRFNRVFLGAGPAWFASGCGAACDKAGLSRISMISFARIGMRKLGSVELHKSIVSTCCGIKTQSSSSSEAASGASAPCWLPSISTISLLSSS